MALRLADGTTIRHLRRPPQGMRHRVLFGVEESSGREVVAKIELIPGALESERRALEWLTSQQGPAPRLLASGPPANSNQYPGALCLVTERVAGTAPTSTDGWERLGVALARLARMPWEGSGLPALDHREFLRLHERRVDDLGEALGRDFRAELPVVPPGYDKSPLTLTHGDPGPGNFLDDGADGFLIDWEDVVVAPGGLDLGRVTFIALLGAGPEGYAAREHAARARAVRSGFLAESGAAPPGGDELTWWLAVAGVQFAHRRLERAGEPGVLPWLDAVSVLEAAFGPGASG
ncbi:MAG: phosphotransferase family protein [Solirubrobacterales bacterium]